MSVGQRQEFTVADAPQYDRRSPLRWIVAHSFRYPVLPVLAAVGFVGGSAMFSLAMLLTGRAFDAVQRPAPTTLETLLTLALAVLGARALQALLNFGGACALEYLGQRIERDAREELYISLLGKSQTFHNRQLVGDVMARATSDVRSLNIMFSPGLRLILEALPNAVVPLVAIALLRWDLLLVPLVFIIVLTVALRRYNNQIGPVAGMMYWKFGALSAQLAETVGGIEVVKAYVTEEAEQRRFMETAREYREFFVQEGQVQARYLPLLIYGLAFGLAFGHVLLLLMNGSISVGEVVTFMGLMTQLRYLTYISLFSFALVQFGLAGAKRIIAMLEAESHLDENPGGRSQPLEGAIRFEQVSFGYGDSPVLHDLSFAADPGETIAIVGQTGAGKTSLTRLINRIYDVGAGRVLVDGVDVREWDLASLRSQIGQIEQDVFLFARTVAQNIAFGVSGPVGQEQIEAAARAAQAHDFIMGLPDGYNTLVGERGVMLSGGQRQRIAIARAFLADPPILILDDSTSAIDSATEDQIQQAIRQIARRRTTLLITHRLAQIRWADRVLLLHQGRLVAQGTHDELLASTPEYRQIFGDLEDNAPWPAGQAAAPAHAAHP
jgi:ATP-binding cassette subfamily B protein